MKKKVVALEIYQNPWNGLWYKREIDAWEDENGKLWTFCQEWNSNICNWRYVWRKKINLQKKEI